MQILNGQPYLYMRKKWENSAEFFYTKCAGNSGKLRKNGVL